LNNSQLWEKLISDGYVPIENEIKLDQPIKIKTKFGIKYISRLVKDNNNIKSYTTQHKYSGRLAN